MASDAPVAERRAAALALVQRHFPISDSSPYDRHPRDVDYAEQFREIGFFRATDTFAAWDGQPVFVNMVSFADTRPRSPIMLFRACNPGLETRVSWTPNFEVALAFTPGGPQAHFHPEAHVFAAVVPPERILAIVHEEWIADVTGLHVHDLGAFHEMRAGTAIRDLIDQRPELQELMDAHGPNFRVADKPRRRVTLKPLDEGLTINLAGSFHTIPVGDEHG